MYAAESLALRVSIVLGMVAAVVTILYFTPLPVQHIKSCDRPCHEFDWPMICRFKLILETYQTLDSSCQDCSTNSTQCDEKCFTSDRHPYGFLTVNRQLPGPSIQVCKNDVVVVDVFNKIPGQSFAIHWRGQHHNEAPFMDGVPMITQCPITSYTTFQYKLRASDAGTHLYHAHSGVETSGGLFGALVVREPTRLDAQKKFYDVDDRNHVIVISESESKLSIDKQDETNLPYLLLINGIAPDGPTHTASFNIKRGKRSRFRVAYAGGIDDCPISLEIEQHFLKVIAIDGNPVVAYEASSIVMAKGERVDFVLKSKFGPSEHFLNVYSLCKENIMGRGVIKCSEAERSKKVTAPNNVFDNAQKITKRRFDSGVCESGIGKICIGDIRTPKKMPKILRSEYVDKRVYLPFDNRLSTYNTQEITSAHPRKYHRMNNITFTFPPSPLQTQIFDVPDNLLCNSLMRPEKCRNQEICECVHVEEISLEDSVEIVLIDQGGDATEHAFHLHGYSFYVVAARKFEEPVRLDKLKSMDERGQLFKRNLHNPVLKDTIRVPKYGVVAIRFIANNPGFWMLRDEGSKSWTRGMDMVFKVGEVTDFVSPPSNFPSCGSWIGPEFFLA